MKNGFTLVELSIVLVIVGLLIGGILVGQSLIESAKINRIVSDLQQYNIATIQFHKKFKQFPGDDPNFSPPGNGNNAVMDIGGCSGVYSTNEGIQFWAHLSQAQMLSKTYQAWSPESCGGTHNNDYGHMSLKNITAPFLPLGVLGFSDYPIVAEKSLGANLLLLFYVTPTQALSLESKMNAQPLTTSPWTNIGLSNLLWIRGLYR